MPVGGGLYVRGTCHNSGSRRQFDTLTLASDRKFQTASIGHSFRASLPQNNAVFRSKQGTGTQTSHNSGSRSPFDTLTSALDRKFQTTSFGHSFRARFRQNKAVLDPKNDLRN